MAAGGALSAGLGAVATKAAAGIAAVAIVGAGAVEVHNTCATTPPRRVGRRAGPGHTPLVTAPAVVSQPAAARRSILHPVVIHHLRRHHRAPPRPATRRPRSRDDPVVTTPIVDHAGSGPRHAAGRHHPGPAADRVRRDRPPRRVVGRQRLDDDDRDDAVDLPGRRRPRRRRPTRRPRRSRSTRRPRRRSTRRRSRLRLTPRRSPRRRWTPPHRRPPRRRPRRRRRPFRLSGRRARTASPRRSECAKRPACCDVPERP